jgi:hypothetical protein
MIRAAAAAAGAVVAVAVVTVALVPGRIAAQVPVVDVTGPASNPIGDAVATFVVRARNFAAIDLPLRLNLQVSTSPSFDGPLYADTTVNDTVAQITIPRLLPGSGQLYWRAFALTARAGSIPSAITGPRTAPTHLRLVSPNNPAGQSLDTRRPTFTWRSSAVPAGFGAWAYELRIESTATGQAVLIARTNDTVLTVVDDLETNASYRWRVIARYSLTDETVEVASAATFVIRSGDAPVATLLYRPFPNPFPNARASHACIWFDLRIAGAVSLDILDFSGYRVRQIVPRPDVTMPMPPGRYGRPASGSPGGCDERFVWDGTDQRGRTVNPGVYIIQLRADGKVFRERTVFQGR